MFFRIVSMDLWGMYIKECTAYWVLWGPICVDPIYRKFKCCVTLVQEIMQCDPTFKEELQIQMFSCVVWQNPLSLPQPP